MSRREPPVTLSPRILSLVAEIGELVGGWRAGGFGRISPKLRRENRIRTIRDTLVSMPATDQVSDQVSDQVKSLLRCFAGSKEMTAAGLMECLHLRHRPTFRKNHLNPALALDLIEMTDPASPRSPVQRYREGQRHETLKSMEKDYSHFDRRLRLAESMMERRGDV